MILTCTMPTTPLPICKSVGRLDGLFLLRRLFRQRNAVKITDGHSVNLKNFPMPSLVLHEVYKMFC